MFRINRSIQIRSTSIIDRLYKLRNGNQIIIKRNSSYGTNSVFIKEINENHGEINGAEGLLIEDIKELTNLLQKQVKLKVQDRNLHFEANIRLFKSIEDRIKLHDNDVNSSLLTNYNRLFQLLFLLLRHNKLEGSAYRLFNLVPFILENSLSISNHVKLNMVAVVMNRLINIEKDGIACSKVYEQVLSSGHKGNVFILNYAIQSYLSLNQREEVKRIVREMKQRKIRFNLYTFNILLKDCSHRKDFIEFKYWWLQLQKSKLKLDSYTRSSILYNLVIHNKLNLSDQLFQQYIRNPKIVNDNKERMILITIMINTADDLESGINYIKLACKEEMNLLHSDTKLMTTVLKLFIKFNQFEANNQLFTYLLNNQQANSKHIYQMIANYSKQNKLIEATKLLTLPIIHEEDELFLNYKLIKEFSIKFSTNDLLKTTQLIKYNNNKNSNNNNKLYFGIYHTILKTLLYRIESYQPIKKKSSDHKRQMEYYTSLLIERMVDYNLINSVSTNDLDLRTITLLAKAYLYLNEYEKADKLIKPYFNEIEDEDYYLIMNTHPLLATKKRISTSTLLYNLIETKLPKFNTNKQKGSRNLNNKVELVDVYILEIKMQILISYQKYQRVFLLYHYYKNNSKIKNSIDFLIHSLYALHSLDTTTFNEMSKQKLILNLLKKIDVLFPTNKQLLLKRVNLFYSNDPEFIDIYF
ncbi:hypothetical protein K502DRAFT_346996 [Neoconidiobolus thromboides FSU 785]|nr:hypothetical protein K502DRAFT_346996 [Neoconidiobolus thromboides FSU 785]